MPELPATSPEKLSPQQTSRWGQIAFWAGALVFITSSWWVGSVLLVSFAYAAGSAAFGLGILLVAILLQLPAYLFFQRAGFLPASGLHKPPNLTQNNDDDRRHLDNLTG